MRPVLSLFAALALPAAVPAQSPATDPACANVRVAIPPELSGWSEQTPVSSGVKPGEGATVSAGKALLVSLHPAKHLTLAPVAEKAAAANSSGGTLAFTVAEAGTYRLALGNGAWVDVVEGGKALTSVAHGHGPKCTGVRKMVDFKLQPGTYAIQLSGSAEPTIALMLAKIA